MSKKIKAPVVKAPSKDEIIAVKDIYIAKLERKVAELSVVNTRLETDVEILSKK